MRWVKGADELAAKTDRIAARIEDPKEAAKDVTEILRARVARQFASGGDGHWAALAAGTLENKARKGQGSQVMRATGALEASLVRRGRARSKRKGQQFVFRAGRAPFYGVIVAGKKPPRPIVVNDVADELAEALAEHLFEGE